ncbi:hypothetical protein TCE0_023r07174 [Talaromyces pinophilus]|uniref:Nucleoside phosphorylase domain-containing protein n=1 Tax=Talaromyces pinophilus TaxID=128442 RepID=A0A0B8N4S4_TALPI|nr:hypothetical protein TCE0_023r07174 [Talaromyces pinophilus]
MRPKSRTEFRTAIICALTLEAEAVEALFDKTYDKFGKIYGKRRGDANSYINGRIGKHDVVLCYMPGMGKGSAASVASSLRVSYTGVQLALVVGICGGAPNPFDHQEIFLGDVIISNALVEYDFGRQYPRGFERKPDALRIPDQEIRTLLAALSTSRARAEFQEEMLHHLHNIQQQGPRWQHPGSADILFEASYLHKHYNPPSRCCCVDSNLPDDICEEAYEKNCNSLGCDENRISRRRDKTGKPSIHIGKVATADMVAMSPHQYEQHLLGQANAGPLLELLDYLLVNKAPANDYDLSGGTPLSRLFTFSTYGSVAKPRISAVAEAILQSNTEASVACLSEPPPAINSLILDQSGRRFYKEGTAVLHHFLGFSARIAEAYGCGPLSLAILSNNPDQVDYLVRNHPATLAERNILGHTPLHLAADKSSCLRVLVTAADTKLLNETDEPVGYAVERVILAACADNADVQSARLFSSMPIARCLCRKTYRAYLDMPPIDVNGDNLPATEVEQLGLVPDHVLDSLASRVVHLLQVRGVCIPEALAVTRTRSLSVYQALRTPWDAEVFFQVGFYDTDSWCDCDAYAAEFGHSPNLTGELPYLHWLAKHGSISCQLKSFESAMDIAIANYTYYKIGEELDDISISWTFGEHLPWRDDKLSPFPTSARRAWVDELNTRILPAKIADTCDCKCSDEGCTPLTSLLKGLLRDNRYKFQSKSRFAKDTGLTSRLIQKISLFLKYFGSDLEVRHHTAALRYLTYTALGIPHTCCIPYYKWLYGLDAEEVENEHAYEMGLLEELMGDFERQIIAIYQGPRWKVSDLIDFWEHTWARRMREILDRLEGGDLGDEESHKAEEIGVIWDEPRHKAPKAAGNPYGKDTLDHWIYELEKIEAECDCSSFAPLPRFVMSGEGELGLGCSFVVKKDEISGDGRCASLRKHLSNSRGELSMEELDTFTDDDLRAAALVEFQKQLAKVAFALAEEKSIAMEATGVNALCIYTAVVTWGVVMGRILYGRIGASYAPALAFMSGPAVISATSPLAQDPKRGDEVAAVASYRVLKEELPNIITGMTIKEVLDMATKLRKDFVALATWYSTAPLKDGAERTKRIVGQDKIGDAELKRGDDASIEDGVTSYKDLLRRRISALEETQSVADTAAATYLQSEQIVANLQAHQAKLNNTNKRRFSVEREITKAEMIIDDLKIMINGTKQQEGRIISVADLLASTLDDLMHVGEPPYHRPDRKIEDRLCTMGEIDPITNNLLYQNNLPSTDDDDEDAGIRMFD